MRVFVDTSAFYASLHAEDEHHSKAQRVLQEFRESGLKLVTTNYVLLESAGLIQRRKDFSEAHRFLSNATETLEIIWVDEILQRKAIAIWSEARARGLSLVDCASFAAMRQAGIRRALAFDRHFSRHGFEVIPPPRQP